MNKPIARVVRFDFWHHPSMAERLARESDIELQTCLVEGADTAAWSALADASVYQISSAKDELRHRWFANPYLLARSPKLLCVSAVGAGCDTIDIPACTAAGVLVVNQAGANAQSVAEHTMGAMLDVSRRISASDRQLRLRRGFSREDLMGREVSGKVLGLVGIGNIGRKVARMAVAFGSFARRGARRLGCRTPTARSPAAPVRQRRRHLSHLWRHARGSRTHGSFRGRSDRRCVERTATSRLLNPEALPLFKERFQSLRGFAFTA